MREPPYIATTLFGLEDILVKELTELGAEEIVRMNRAVGFSGSQAMMYKINIGARTAMRVLKNIHSFRANNEDELYKNIYSIRWEDHFTIKKSFMINSAVSSQRFTHSHFVSQKVKDAIADRFRKITSLRPSVNTENPDIVINIHISNDVVNVALDSSGEPLFKRGYRVSQYIAPLNEVLAAGMLMIAGWEGKGNFVDPMCGSGTLPIEATLIAKKIPPGIFRNKFGFMNWNDYDETLFKRLLEQMLNPVEFNGSISASDISEEAIHLTKRNLDKALISEFVQVQKADFKSFDPPAGGGIIILNPPYGERLKEDEIDNFYEEIGDTFKKKYPGYQAWILSSNIQALKHIGLHPEKKYSLVNGSLKCKFQKYLIYEGSKKLKKS
jgi:putative N6-adenine-specific DNA methylase